MIIENMNVTGAGKKAARRSVDPHFAAQLAVQQGCDALKDLLAGEPFPSPRALQKALATISAAIKEVDVTRPTAQRTH